MKMFFRAAALMIAGFMATPTFAHDYTLGTLHVLHPWARASAGHVPNGAAYMTLSNTGAKADRLIAVSTPVAKRATLHTHLMDKGIMRMRPLKAIEIAPGSPTALKPGGLHIMLMGLTAPLKEGQLIPLRLTFERAGTLDIEALVQKPGAMAPSHRHKEPGSGS